MYSVSITFSCWSSPTVDELSEPPQPILSLFHLSRLSFFSAGGRKDIHQRLVNVLTRLVEEGGASVEHGGGAWQEGHAHTALNF